MRKYGVFIWMLFAVIACQQDGLSTEDDMEDKVQEETKEEAEECNLSLSGSIINGWGSSAFKVQLIKGEVNTRYWADGYIHPEAQVFITEKNNLEFGFNGLQEGKYTLCVTKRGYKICAKVVNVGRLFSNTIYILMEEDNTGITDEMQILDEEGHDLSKIEVTRSSTKSVCFYLYNGTGIEQSYNITYWSDGYVGKTILIDGKFEYLSSDWITEMKPRSGTLKPNGITLVEAVIDPLVYLLKEHSSCSINVSFNLWLKLSY